MDFRVILAGALAGLALMAGLPARADVAYDAAPMELPYRANTGLYEFAAVAAPGATASLFVVGDSESQPTQESTIGYLGPLTGTTTQVAWPALTDLWALATAATAVPEPIVAAVGFRSIDGNGEMDLQVFSGTPPTLRSSVRLDPALEFPTAAVFTRVASPTDFDLVVGGSRTVSMFHGLAKTPAWQADMAGESLALLPASGALPLRIATTGGIIDASDGHVLWTTSQYASKVLVGKVRATGSPQVVALGGGRVSIYDSNPPVLRWTSDGLNANDIALGDRDGDGVMEILVALGTGDAYWINGSGLKVGPTVVLPVEPRVVVAKIDAAPARVVAMSSDFTGARMEVRSLDLATVVTSADAQQGPFGRIAIGDVDGDGDDEVVSIAGIPWGNGSSIGPSGRLSIRDRATNALVWRSAIPAGLGVTGSDVMLDAAIGHVQAGAHRQIVVLGRDGTGLYEPIVDVVDGTSHAVLRRSHVDLGGRDGVRLRLVDVDGDGLDEIVILSTPHSGETSGVRVHVLRADTLAPLWTSPVLTPQTLVTSTFLRPVAGAAPHLVLTVQGAGLWSIDLAAHLVDYSVPADAAGATVTSDPAASRIVLVDATQQALVVVDATNGAEIDRIPLPDRPYGAIAAMPGDPDRVAVAARDHLETWNVAHREQEGSSPAVGHMLGDGGTLLARARAGGGATFYAGNNVGIWTFPTRTYAPLIFKDGFEP